MSNPGGRQFLFVNKDSSSASFSNSRNGPLTHAQINHHVQKQVKHRIPARRKKCIITSTSHLIGWERAPHHGEREGNSNEKRVAIISREEDFILTPFLLTDSFCNPTFSLDNDKQSILQYFNEVWMPSKGRIPHGCVLNGFSPIWPNDDQLSLDVVRGAFQSKNEVSIYALLTASTRRMRMINRLNYPKTYLPDFYALKAVQALRTFIASGERPSERLILDMSYLGLAELYVRSPSRSEVYWKMTHNLIVNCGGFGNIAPFTTQSALAFDLLVAGGTLTVPTLNPFEHPVLLGLESAPGSTSYNSYNIKARLRQLDLRIQVLCEASDYLSQTIKAIRDLPEAAVNGLERCLENPGSRLFALVAVPFLPSACGVQKQTVSYACITADALSAHLRFHAFMIWLWNCALGCLDEGADPTNFICPLPHVRSETSNLWKYIDRIYCMLDDTGWAMQDQAVLWICALGVLVATSEVDRSAYIRLLVSAASSLDVTSKGRLEDVLDKYLPLERIPQYTSDKIWDLIAENQI